MAPGFLYLEILFKGLALYFKHKIRIEKMRKLILLCAAFLMVTGFNEKTFAAGDNTSVEPQAPSKGDVKREPLTDQEIAELVTSGSVMASWHEDDVILPQGE